MPQQRVKAVMQLIKMMLETIGRPLQEFSLPNTLKLTSYELQMKRKITSVIVFKMNQNIMWNFLYWATCFSFSVRLSTILYIIFADVFLI